MRQLHIEKKISIYRSLKWKIHIQFQIKNKLDSGTHSVFERDNALTSILYSTKSVIVQAVLFSPFTFWWTKFLMIINGRVVVVFGIKNFWSTILPAISPFGVFSLEFPSVNDCQCVPIPILFFEWIWNTSKKFPDNLSKLGFWEGYICEGKQIKKVTDNISCVLNFLFLRKLVVKIDNFLWQKGFRQIEAV